MNAFTKAIDDIFKVQDFLEQAFIGDDAYDVICTPIEDGISYTDAGLVSDLNFRLSMKLPIRKMPKIGDKVKFRDASYKILSIERDSANASIYLSLESLTKG